jgi:CRISPR/Cas system endoribonuclease Cas6 (RAMP superfamily)
MKRLLLFAAILFVAAVAKGQAENHGVTLTWTASTSAATCTSPCVGKYLLFEGPSPGAEVMTAPLATVSALTYTDDGVAMNTYLGTTRCYVVQFQTTTGAVVLNSASSGEACATWPSTPSTVTGVVVTIH